MVDKLVEQLSELLFHLGILDKNHTGSSLSHGNLVDADLRLADEI